MTSNRQIFLEHIAQTSPSPIAIEMVKASGVKMFDEKGNEYFDLISGVSVSNLGHCHPVIVNAVQKQAETFMHLMVYGELIQQPQVQFAQLLCSILPENLNSVYFVNSGSEAIEGAMKLAKRATGRKKIIAFNNAYHGSTQGAMSLMGSDYFKSAFQPLLPEIEFIDFNNFEQLKKIDIHTACVIAEVIQGEAGVINPVEGFLEQLRNRCTEQGALLVFDEIQTGFGRTGNMFAFQKIGIIPDIFTIAKAMGGGMPIGAFVTSSKLTNLLTYNPVLGHITTFGGHPVCVAAALANLNFLIENSEILYLVESKAKRFYNLLICQKNVKEIRYNGLLMAVELGDKKMIQDIMNQFIINGILSDWFLFNETSFRISPPLIINDEDIDICCHKIIKCLNSV